ncbi:HIT domain-containing protein [Nocardioides sp.]|uniref:HIT domain-containing protein n=1 Tax=Nocardioides sp. TaxID=35761 RepID=UPI0026181237|nr:HIT domain-containing protein [Nocardioides sp.]
MTDFCLFCGIAAGDIASVKVAEGASTYAFMDINPASDGHVLVISKRHSRDLLDISAEDLADVTSAAQRIAKAAVEVFDADGVNLLSCSGAGRGSRCSTSTCTSSRAIPTPPRTGLKCRGNRGRQGTRSGSPTWATGWRATCERRPGPRAQTAPPRRRRDGAPALADRTDPDRHAAP